MYKSLCDLTTEVTLDKRADKLREDVTVTIKRGCSEKGQLPSYFKSWNEVWMYGKRYELEYSMKTLTFNAATGLKGSKLSIIYQKYMKYVSRHGWTLVSTLIGTHLLPRYYVLVQYYLLEYFPIPLLPIT